MFTSCQQRYQILDSNSNYTIKQAQKIRSCSSAHKGARHAREESDSSTNYYASMNALHFLHRKWTFSNLSLSKWHLFLLTTTHPSQRLSLGKKRKTMVGIRLKSTISFWSGNCCRLKKKKCYLRFERNSSNPRMHAFIMQTKYSTQERWRTRGRRKEREKEWKSAGSQQI